MARTGAASTARSHRVISKLRKNARRAAYARQRGLRGQLDELRRTPGSVRRGVRLTGPWRLGAGTARARSAPEMPCLPGRAGPSRTMFCVPVLDSPRTDSNPLGSVASWLVLGPELCKDSRL